MIRILLIASIYFSLINLLFFCVLFASVVFAEEPMSLEELKQREVEQLTQQNQSFRQKQATEALAGEYCYIECLEYADKDKFICKKFANNGKTVCRNLENNQP